jgi:hypothetical protein
VCHLQWSWGGGRLLLSTMHITREGCKLQEHQIVLITIFLFF